MTSTSATGRATLALARHSAITVGVGLRLLVLVTVDPLLRTKIPHH